MKRSTEKIRKVWNEFIEKDRLLKEAKAIHRKRMKKIYNSERRASLKEALCED